MLGKKKCTQKLFYQITLDNLVPKDHFYHRLDNVLDLQFLNSETRKYYGSKRRKSIDRIVFFKVCLIGYLENIISDRKLIDLCSDSLAIRLFLGFDLDKQLPWHSTISRTRHLYEASLFEQVFRKILVMANASMDSLELKVPQEELDAHLRNIRHISEMDKEEPHRKAQNNMANTEQRTITASDSKLNDINTRQKKWAKDQDQRPGAGNICSKYTSNKTHYSPTDPDARISVKPGKARKLNYYAEMAVDTAHQIITQIQADFADKKDNQYLQDLVANTKKNLKDSGLAIENLLADAGYSSGENYAWLEEQKIKSYIPPHGTYKGGPNGFEFIGDGNYWRCPENKKVLFKKQVVEKGTLKNHYRTSVDDCRNCPLKENCLSKSQYSKKISITAHRSEYERNNERLAKNKYHKAK